MAVSCGILRVKETNGCLSVDTEAMDLSGVPHQL